MGYEFEINTNLKNNTKDDKKTVTKPFVSNSTNDLNDIFNPNANVQDKNDYIQFGKTKTNNYYDFSKTEKDNITDTTKGETQENIDDIIQNAGCITELEDTIKGLSDVEKLALLQKNPDSSIVNFILDSNPSREVLSKIDEKYMIDSNFKNANAQVYDLNESAQKFVVEQNKQAGTLNNIDRSQLFDSVRDIFDKLKGKGKENKDFMA